MDRRELLERMKQLDDLVHDLYPDNTFECIIVGGSALLLKNIISRGTLDVDVLAVSKEVQELFPIYDFNTRVQSLLDCFPYNYEDRLERIHVNTKHILFYTPSTEDLIVSKLYAYRDKDIEDLNAIKSSKIYNKKRLQSIVDEAKLSSVTPRRYDEMYALYQRFFEE